MHLERRNIKLLLPIYPNKIEQKGDKDNKRVNISNITLTLTVTLL